MGYFRADGAVSIEGLSDAVFDSPAVRGARESLVAAHERAVRDPAGAFVWVALFAPTKAELAAVTAVFDLDPHQVEDAGNIHQRAKTDLGKDRTFVVLKTLSYRPETRQVETGQVAVFTGPTYVLTVRQGTTRDLRELRDRIAGDPTMLARGPIGVLHAISDRVVDGYLLVSEQVQQEVERLEEAVFSPRAADISGSIYLLKRENLEIRRAVSPLLTLATDLARETLEDLPEQMGSHFRDIGEHLLRVADQAEAVDNLLLALMAAANARADLKQSADQRRMAAWAAIALVPTMIGSIYGMNFAFMPELDWPWGYPLVLLLMVVVIVVLYRRFRAAGWL
jgi:magnesium transporter